MVRKCCVPRCTSRAGFPSHVLPAEQDKAQAWLNAIGLNNMIDAPWEVKAKLRICGLHFCEEMVVSYGQRRRLTDNAIPTLYVPMENIAANNASSSSADIDTIAASQVLSQDVEHKSSFAPEIHSERQHTNINVKRTENIRQLRQKIRRYQEALHKKNSAFRKIKESKAVKRTMMWDDVTAEMTDVQTTFMDIIAQDFFLKTGRRYDVKQKVLALTLYKTMGKRAYTRLREVFKHIPSRQSLQLVLQMLPVTAGLNPFILQHLKNISLQMYTKDKVCILMWDEIAIQPIVTYDTRRDIICGFEDWGNSRTNKVADRVLVFMLRGLRTGWKVPVSYNFCAKANMPQLVRCIKEHVSKISEIGFPIVATVCDQKTSNVAAINHLLNHTDKQRKHDRRTQAQTFEVGNIEVVPLFDPLHLIKCIRNNFLVKDLDMNDGSENRVASWDVIRRAWIMDKKINTMRPQLKKITKEHIVENEINKMHVKYATQVLSGTVASCIETLTRFKCIVEMEDFEEIRINTEEGIATAKAVLFFNNLFDSMNGTDVYDNKLRAPLTEDSAHHAFWTNAKNVIRNMRYIDKPTRKHVKSVPTLKTYLFTIDGFEKLWKIIKIKYDINILKTRHCNHDPIENFFGRVRSHAVRYNNPMPRQFQDSFITLLINNMKSVSVINGNCETAEDPFMLLNLEKYLEDNLVTEETCDVDRNNDDDEDELREMFSIKIVPEQISIAFLNEKLDEIIITITKQLNFCEQCNISLKNSEFAIFARQIACRINKLLETRSHWRDILKVLIAHFDNWVTNVGWHECIEHHTKIFKLAVRVICKEMLTWWCITKNNLMYSASDKDNLLSIEDRKKIKKEHEAYKLVKYKRKLILNDYRSKVHKKCKNYRNLTYKLI